jgi:hypothetical protein
MSIYELAQRLVRIRPEKGLKVTRVDRSKNEAYSENVLLKGVEIPPSSNKLRGLGWSPVVDVETGFDRVLKYLEGESANENARYEKQF